MTGSKLRIVGVPGIAMTGSFARCSTRIGLVIAVGLLASCAAGPDFRRPDAPTVQKYTIGAQAEKTADSGAGGGGVQQFLPQQKIPQDWWTLFKSEQLNKLIQRGLTNVGSSRVDLQACKLEYSIVSPK